MRLQIFFWLLFSSSCIPQNMSSLKEIIGPDQRTFLRPGERSADSVVAKVLDSVFILAEKCSAFIIERNIAVTAGHCFTEGKPQELLVHRSKANRKSCKENSLQLKNVSAQCVDIIALEVSKDADFAIFSFTSNPTLEVLAIDTRGGVGNRTVRVAGFLPKIGTFYSAPCSTKILIQNLTVGAFEFAHGCDTMGGASGAPVFDAKTGLVLGIQSGGIANEANLATSISVIAPILSKLKEQ